MVASTCIFCRIARREIPSHIVHESDDVVAFLDIHPIRLGHTLVVPREHHAYFDDLPPALAAEIVAVGQKLAPVLRAAAGVPRVGFLFTGVDVAHAHAHVVPMLEATDVTSTQYIVERPLTFRPAPAAPQADLEAMADSVRARLGQASFDTSGRGIGRTPS